MRRRGARTVNHAVPVRTLAETVASPSRLGMEALAIALATLGTVSTSIHAQVAIQTQGLDPGTLADITDAIVDVVDGEELAGAVVAFSRLGRIAYLQPTVFQNIDPRVPMRNDSIFRIYGRSLSTVPSRSIASSLPAAPTSSSPRRPSRARRTIR